MAKEAEVKPPKVLNVRCGEAVHVGAQVISSLGCDQWEMGLTATGVKCKKAGKTFLIPWQNINSCELSD